MVKESSNKHVHFVAEPSDKHVRFGPVVKIADDQATVAEPILATTQLGAGKARPLRDLSVLVGILAILFAISSNFELPGVKKYAENEELPEGNRIPFAEKINQAFAKLVDKLDGGNQHARVSQNEHTTDCPIYVCLGELFDTGYSLYSGKKRYIGETITVTWPTWTIPPPEQPDSDPIPAHAFLVKPHPTKANVKGVFVAPKEGESPSYELVVTNTIEAGEELFCSFDDHPVATHESDLFRHIPREREHNLAISFVKDMDLTSKRLAAAHRKRGHQIYPRQHIQGIMERTLKHFDKRVAAMIRKERTFSMGIHREQSTCLTDMSGGDDYLSAAREFVNGDVVGFVPLLVYNCTVNSEEQECGTAPPPCRQLVDDGTVVCPLTAPWPETSEDANIRIEWLKDEQTRGGKGVWAWKIVATRSIPTGQKMVLSAWDRDFV